MQLGIGAAQQWFAASSDEEFAAKLALMGADFVEFAFSQEEIKSNYPWFKACWQAGLKLSFHSPYETGYNIRNFKENRKLFLALFESYNEIALAQKSLTRINLHCALGNQQEDKGELFNLTAQFLSWLYHKRRQNSWNLDFVLELLPHDPKRNRVGDKVSELLLLKELLPDLKLNFCWDLGHFQRNLLSGYDGMPPEAFLKSVKHLHLHDIRGEDDHHPLVFNRVPFLEYFTLLDFNQNQLMTALELNFNSTSRVGEPFLLLGRSFEQLKKGKDQLKEKLSKKQVKI